MCDDGYYINNEECILSPYNCPTGQFACPNGQCVNNVNLCDKQPYPSSIPQTNPTSSQPQPSPTPIEPLPVPQPNSNNPNPSSDPQTNPSNPAQPNPSSTQPQPSQDESESISQIRQPDNTITVIIIGSVIVGVVLFLGIGGYMLYRRFKKQQFEDEEMLVQT